MSAAGLEASAQEVGLTAFLVAWLGAFYLGELFLAVGYLRAGPGAVPRWIPALLLLHAAGLALAGGPGWVPPVVTALLALALSGLGIRVAQAPRA